MNTDTDTYTRRAEEIVAGRRYTADEDQFIQAHYGRDMSIFEIAGYLERSVGSVGNRVFRLRSRGLMGEGYRVLPYGGLTQVRSNGWTAEQEEILWREWGVTPDPELSQKLEKTLVAMQERAYLIGASKRYNRQATRA